MNIVALIGRANVGKSTLFNKLTGHNTAIVDDLPGITRDRHYASAEWAGQVFTVIDTGGYAHQATHDMVHEINEQIQIALAESDLLLFMVDCKTGITAEDDHLAQQLRRLNKPVLLVANKADNPASSFQSAEFHRLGLGYVHTISAAHGTGTGDLLDAIVQHLTPSSASPEHHLPRIACIGRTNTGKSTFVNALLGHHRSIVDAQPHTTRVPTHSHYRRYNNELLLIDTAGIAKKKQIPTNSIAFYALLRTLKAIDAADVCLVFVDATEGLTNQDKNILTLAHRKKKGIVLLINKWDLFPKDNHRITTYRHQLQQKLGFMHYVPILYTSGLHKKNIYQTIEKALHVYNNLRKKIPTAALNKHMQQILAQHPLPLHRGRPLKINYATQLPVRWPMFAIFCNFPKHIPTNYQRYMEKQLRAVSNFQGVPITLSFRPKNTKASRDRD